MSVTAVIFCFTCWQTYISKQQQKRASQLSVNQGGRNKKYFKARKQTDCKDCNSDQRHLLPSSRSPLPPSLPTVLQIFLGDVAILALFFPSSGNTHRCRQSGRATSKIQTGSEKSCSVFPSLNSITNFFFQSKTPLLYPKRQSLTLEPIGIVSKNKKRLEPTPLKDGLLKTLNKFLLGSQFCQTGSK